MSVRVMSDVFSADLDSPTDKLMLLALADHAADDGSSVYPSIERLSLKCDISERSVQRYLRRLERADLIRVERKASRHSPTRYQLNLAAIRARIPAEVRGDRGDSTVTPEAVRGDKRGRSGVTAVSPDSSVEPSGEPNHQRVREEFDLFWAQYPKHEAKERARKSWTEITPDNATVERILAALEVQKRSDAWKRDGGRYVPHASSWLNGRRWDDEGTVVKARATTEIYVEPGLVKVWNEHRGTLMKAWAGDDEAARRALALEPDLARWTRAVQLMVAPGSRYRFEVHTFSWITAIKDGQLQNLEAVLGGG